MKSTNCTMETLFSFIPKVPPSFDASLIRTAKKPNIKPISNSSFNIFQPMKKLLSQRFSIKTSTISPQEIINIVQGGKQKQHHLHDLIFKPLDDFISTFIDDVPLPPFIDPKHVLTGNFFSPLEELPPTPCEVVMGSLPPCLNGAYIQNGPSPQFIPRGPYHHVDGDGMLHSIKISGGKATFCSRFVKTHKYTVERGLGYPVFPNIFACFNNNIISLNVLSVLRLFLTGHFKPFSSGLGPANTSLALFGGHLFALVETDLPYEIKIMSDGDIITIGRHDLHSNKRLLHYMTAHPKVDPDTGETFAFRYFVIPPFLSFFRIDSNGRKQNDVPIYSMKGASFIHDFAVSKNFAIFPDPQIVMNPFEIMRGRSIMRVDRNKIPRLGVIPRYAEDEREMWWVDVPGLNVLHVVNAWEEDDNIVIIATNVLSVEHALEEMDLIRLSLEKITIDVRGKKVVGRYPVSDRNLDFGVINPQYALKKNRYIYASAIETMPKIVGVVKVDLSLSDGGDCTVASRMYGPGCYGSEPVFVARESNNPVAEEDDGYLLAYIHNENTKESKFIVMDAKSPTLDIIAAVRLPGRVSRGFHALFVKEIDLQNL